MIALNKKNIISLIRVVLFTSILYLIYKEINQHTIDLASLKERFKLNFFIFALIFFIITQLIGSYIFYLIVGLINKVKLFYLYRVIFTGQFLDYFPFLGLAYKAKRLKDDLNFGYKKFVVIYIFLLKIGLFSISTILSIFYFLPFDNSLNLDEKIFYIFFFIFFSIIIFIILIKPIFSIFRKKYFSIIVFKKKINFVNIITTFLIILRKSLFRNGIYFKCYALDLIAHVPLFICYLFVFKCYQININIIDILLIYMLFSISTMVKILPKNYGIDEIIGSYLIELSSGSFALGLSVMITIRIISLISTLILFVFFNVDLLKNYKKNDTKENI